MLPVNQPTHRPAFPHLSVEQVLDRHPLTVEPSVTVAAVVEKMGQATGQTCQLAALDLESPAITQSELEFSRGPGLEGNHFSCALIVEDSQLLGIFTERDLVRLVAAGIDLDSEKISAVMTQPVISLEYVQNHNIFTILTLLKRHRIRQLPILDQNQALLGIVTQTGIRQAMQPFNFLKLRRVGDVMTRTVVTASATKTLLDLAQQMARHQVSCIVITEVKQQEGKFLEIPIGIVTERDIVQFRALDLVLANTTAGEVMSTPLFLVQPQDTLWDAHQQMQQRHTRRLVVANGAGTLVGILTQSSLLQPLDPTEMLQEMEQLQRLSEAQTVRLNEANQQLHRSNQKLQLEVAERQRLEQALQDANRILEERVGLQTAQLLQTNEALKQEVQERQRTQVQLTRQYQQSQLLSEMTRKIRESLDIESILQTAVTEVRQLLICDRVVVIECISNSTGQVIQSSMDPAALAPAPLNQIITGLNLLVNDQPNMPKVCACDDLKSGLCSVYTAQFVEQLGARSCLEVEIYVGNQLWGLITALQNHRPRQWDPFEVELMRQFADQMGVAIAQTQLLDTLENKVEHRTDQLIQANRELEREIQDRIQTEKALRESQEKLAGILDNADDAIISIDEQQQIVMYNQGAEQIFGYAPSEVLGHTLDILLPQAFQHVHRQHVRQFASAPATSRQMADRSRDVMGRRKNGAVFPAEASISRLQTETGPIFTVILKDITERRQAEVAIRRSEAQLRLTTDALPVLICYVDSTQCYRFNNQTYEAWFQIPVQDLLGRPIQAVMGEQYYQLARSHIEAALKGEEVDYEMTTVTPDGKSRDLAVTYIPDIDAKGEVKGFFGLINDISDRKTTERMKDEFVSVVSHELRTPLTSIHGSLKLLATQQLGSLVPQGQEMLAIALKNTERLTRLINDVLDLERIESGQITMAMQRCNVAALMVQSAEAMQPMADEHGIQLSVEPLDVKIWADPDHITQTLTNLLSNAIKFSPTDAQVWLGATDQASDVLIQVKDQGRGIPADKLNTIFERFQQVDASASRERGGTGLGLAICKQIVRRHGGSIWVESTFGSGSCFYFTLPKRGQDFPFNPL